MAMTLRLKLEERNVYKNYMCFYKVSEYLSMFISNFVFRCKNPKKVRSFKNNPQFLTKVRIKDWCRLVRITQLL